jgi:hypothetical protein
MHMHMGLTYHRSDDVCSKRKLVRTHFSTNSVNSGLVMLDGTMRACVCVCVCVCVCLFVANGCRSKCDSSSLALTHGLMTQLVCRCISISISIWHARTHAHATHMHALTRARAHTHIHARTHTHTHTHTQMVEDGGGVGTVLGAAEMAGKCSGASVYKCDISTYMVYYTRYL